MEMLMAAIKEPGNPSPCGYRYYVDLRNGAFIYVFSENSLPPEGWPLVELQAREVENYLTSEDD